MKVIILNWQSYYYIHKKKKGERAGIGGEICGRLMGGERKKKISLDISPIFQ